MPNLPDNVTGVTVEAEFNDDGTASILVEIRQDGQEPRRVEGMVSPRMLAVVTGLADRMMPGILDNVTKIANDDPMGVVVIPENLDQLGE